MFEFDFSAPSRGAPRPCVRVAVVMQRERIDNRWQPWRWSLAEIVPHSASFGASPRLLVKDDAQERWLHPGFEVELFTDDAEGYNLNLTTPQPCLWVVWRMEEEPAITEDCIAVPRIVTLSYNDAGRWLDSQENVEQVPAPPEVVQWMQEFVDAHFVQETKRRKRPESFKTLQDRFGNPARVSTEKKFGPGHG
ncbi:MAG: DUF3305 domain-containing protein [Pseudomonadota bacterium]